MGYFLSIKSLFFERIIGELLEHKRRFLRRSSMEKLERYFQRNFRDIGKMQDNPLCSSIQEKPPLCLDSVEKSETSFVLSFSFVYI